MPLVPPSPMPMCYHVLSADGASWQTGFDVSEDHDGTLFKSRVVQGAEFGSPNEASFCESKLTFTGFTLTHV